MVVKVRKVMDYRSKMGPFDYESFLVSSQELSGSFVSPDGENVLGIHVAHGIPMNATNDLYVKALKLFHGGGCVERAKDKEAAPMAMFGYRIASKFER
jgi:hypothetical protein